MPARDLKEFIAWLKENPQATQGTTGAGGISTVGGLFFQKETGTRFRFVPYRIGLAAAMQDLVAGRIDFMIDTAANSLPQVRAGTIKAFAITGRQRLAAAPDIPTVDEEGLSGLHALNWQAVFLPKGRISRGGDKTEYCRRSRVGRWERAATACRHRTRNFSA
jgi:tripartite-type tricarboxylate transporter receptor subunit TctC